MKRFWLAALAACMVLAVMAIALTANITMAEPDSAAFSTEPMIAAGYGHTLALRHDGTVWAWGRNQAGRLGDGTTTNRGAPVQVQGLSNITSIAAGLTFSAALRDDGTVWIWGQHAGTQTNSTVPVRLQNLENITDIAAAGWLVALRENGTVWGCGEVPDEIEQFTNVAAFTFINTSLGGLHVLQARRTNGTYITITSVPENGYGNGGVHVTESSTRFTFEGILTNLVDEIITAFDEASGHGAVIRNDRTVWMWLQSQGEEAVAAVQLQNLINIAAISLGREHGVALRQDGYVFTWGHNRDGALGNGTLPAAGEYMTSDFPLAVAQVRGPGGEGHLNLAAPGGEENSTTTVTSSTASADPSATTSTASTTTTTATSFNQDKDHTTGPNIPQTGVALNVAAVAAASILVMFGAYCGWRYYQNKKEEA